MVWSRDSVVLVVKEAWWRKYEVSNKVKTSCLLLSLQEKCAHLTVMWIGMLAIPVWVITNVRSYNGEKWRTESRKHKDSDKYGIWRAVFICLKLCWPIDWETEDWKYFHQLDKWSTHYFRWTEVTDSAHQRRTCEHCQQIHLQKYFFRDHSESET